MRAKNLLVISAGAAIILGGSTAAAAGVSGPHAATPAPAPHAATCVYTKTPPADRYQGLPHFTKRVAAQPFSVRMDTTQGQIDFRALTAKAPCTTFSFRFLTQHGYFDRTHCHRLTTRRIFVLQCGDPTGTGSGGPGYKFPDENLTGATYPAGTVAMANAGPDTNGSQFFFVYKNTKLSPAYTPFGVVTKGLDVLRKVARAGSDNQNGPGDGYPRRYVGFRHVQIVRR